jgi:hypothetical protein
VPLRPVQATPTSLLLETCTSYSYITSKEYGY